MQRRSASATANPLRPGLAVLMVMLMLVPGLAGAAVRAWFDRDRMHVGETVSLNIECDSATCGQPDLSPLDKDFDQLSTSNSRSVNIVNGQTSARQLWAVAVQPRHEGVITVPALAVGSERTAPVQLTVLPASQATQRSGDDIFIEYDASPREAYVQQQLHATVKLYYAVNLTDGVLDELTAPGVVVQKLAQDRSYESEQGGRRYHVLERRYAVFAEKSGPLTLPAINFRGRALSARDPGGFFSRGNAVSARANAIDLVIKARPADSGSGPWLPAESVELRAEGAGASVGHSAIKGKVGEPVTLTLTVQAKGQTFEQIPELTLPEVDGAEVYPDKAVTRTRDDGDWVYGERSRKFAIVPSRPGTLHVPAVTLEWWNTQTNTMATATTAAFDITVEGVAGAAAPVRPIISTPAGDALPVAGEVAPVAAQAGPWRAIALASLGLWAVTLVTGYLLWRRTRAPVVRRPNTAQGADAAALGARGAFARAAAAGQAGASARHLLAWARAEGLAVQNLGELADQLDDDAQKQAIGALQAALYGTTPGIAMPPLATVFGNGFRRRPRASAAANEDELPRLWPSDDPSFRQNRGTR
ncbi:BatD family protein [Tahibacter amnicola]|uniref:BatD family protein n=1 Tax=Tahibacter amnicola TaxID=2976241 RepID=A0ABY6BHD4_9GAMM|nr:BatD family protein [Tahibacter amnicola]UXI69001.1 BatD family protein [Tahibacter amnicola]